MKVKLVDVHHGTKPGREHYIYACLRDAKTNELLVSADLDYCIKAVLERGWTLVK